MQSTTTVARHPRVVSYETDPESIPTGTAYQTRRLWALQLSYMFI